MVTFFNFTLPTGNTRHKKSTDKNTNTKDITIYSVFFLHAGPHHSQSEAENRLLEPLHYEKHNYFHLGVGVGNHFPKALTWYSLGQKVLTASST